MAVIDYRKKNIADSKGFVPFFVHRYEQGGKTYKLYRAYYNPSMSLDEGFNWWENEDCKINWQGEWCQLPDGSSEMEALIFDSNTKKWYYCKTIHDATDKSNWVEITKQVKDDGFLNTPNDSKIKRREQSGSGDKRTGKGENEAELETGGKDDFEKSGWVKMEWLKNPLVNAYAKLMTMIFGKGTKKKKRTLLFIGIGLLAGKVLSDKDK